MHLFTEYLQPLTIWLHTHPNWALFITFLISFTESLAIIGSIIPGSVTMTAIGILAGSGVMRIDFTLIAAILGAVAGDTSSYFIGYYFSDRLVSVWPFKRYPHWLSLGKDYFSRHGGKSVLIGRFIGPLRSIIPVIAGMMHMSQWRFIVANVISAIGWSILYLGPGIVIGAASNELSAENATRFFIIILLLLVFFWLLSLFIKWLLIRANRLLSVNLHRIWAWSQKHPMLAGYFLALTPADEKNHYPTASLVVLAFVDLLILVFLLILGLATNWISNINEAVHLFLQSIRIPELDALFVSLSELISLPTLLMSFIAVISFFLYKKKYRICIYISSVFISSFLISKGLSFLFYVQRPPGILVNLPGSSFPQINLTVATAFFGFLAFYMNYTRPSAVTRTLKTILLLIIPVSGFAVLYLSDNWLFDVIAALLIGKLLCVLHWLFYRKHSTVKKQLNVYAALCFLGLLILTTTLSVWINYPHLIHDHVPYHKQFIITEKQWWQQNKPILPIYRDNRFGHKVNLLNIQYHGSLDKLKQALTVSNWTTYEDSLFSRLLNRMNAKERENTLPLLSQLHNNQNPVLLMTYFNKDCQCLLVLRLWPSNYHIYQLENNIWIGSMHINNHYQRVKPSKSQSRRYAINPVDYISLPDDRFQTRQVDLSQSVVKPLAKNGVHPSILLIKESGYLDSRVK